MTAIQEQQLKYWEAFTAFMETYKSRFTAIPHAKHCYEVYFGGKDVHIEAIISTRPKENRVEFYLTGPDATKRFNMLKEKCSNDAAAVLGELQWVERPDGIMSKITKTAPADLLDTAHWPQQFEWLRTNIEAMHRYFEPHLKAL